MSYIDREAVLDRLAKVDMDPYYGFTAAVQFGVDHAIQCIKEEPAADVAPVRHGRWIELSRTSKCSECGFETGRYEPPRRYCPECGARMDGKEDEHEAG